MSRLARLPALAGMPTLAGGDVRVHALDPMGHVLMQVASAADAARAESLVNLPLPSTPNRARGLDPLVLWIGPRAWAVLTAKGDDAAALAVRAAAALRAIGGHAVDLTDAHQSLRIEGSDATLLLAQGCPIDLADSAFAVGCATRTLMARTTVLLHRVEADAYLLHVDRSLARQLWDWLEQGVAEIAALSPRQDEAERSLTRGAHADRDRRQDFDHSLQGSSP